MNIKFDEYWEFITKEQLSEEEFSNKKAGFEKLVLNIMSALATNRYAKVIFYPYRTARVYDELFDAERDSMLPLEYLLAIKAGARPDNHTVYEVYNGCSTYYVWFHDGICRIGTSIEKG